MRFVFDFADRCGRPARRVYTQPREIVLVHDHDEVRPALARIGAAAAQGLHAAGYVSYEAATAFDAACKVRAPGGLPLLCFGLFDAPQPDKEPPPTGPFEVTPWWLNTERETYGAHIETIRAAIRRGDVYQVNYTLRARATLTGDDFAYYEQLRRAQRAEYCAYMDLGRFRILSASPELFFRWHDGVLTARPMKGTARRGYVPEEDAALARWLRDSEKNRAENLMIVDLLRNDLSRLSLPGGVEVPALFSIEHYPTVLQMTSTITAHTRPGATLGDVFAALFPCGSITGAPKIKAMEIIARLESEPRGAYCGAIGFVAPDGEAVFNVAIRTVTLDSDTGALECGLGGGITWGSSPDEEYEEVLTKARFLENQPLGFDLLETLRLEDGRYWLLERHLARLAQAAAHFGFTAPGAVVGAALADYARAHERGKHRVRLLYACDGSVRMEGAPLDEMPLRRPAVTLARTPVSRADTFLYFKTTQRAIYDAHTAAAPPEAFDVLLWNENGGLTEFTRGNLVVEIDGKRYTPPVTCGLLGGTFRGELLARGEIAERVILRDDLGRASRIWFINSVRGWVEVEPVEVRSAASPAA